MSQNRTENRFNPLDFEPDVAIGLGLPLVHPNSGDFTSPVTASFEGGDSEVGTAKHKGGVFNSTYTTKEQAKNNLINILLTEPGERIFLPNFGVGLRQLLFENEINEDGLKEQIYSQVEQYLPQITITDIAISRSPIITEGPLDAASRFLEGQGEISHFLYIVLSFRLNQTNETDTIQLNFNNPPVGAPTSGVNLTATTQY